MRTGVHRGESWTNEIAQQAAYKGLGKRTPAQELQRAKMFAAIWRWVDRAYKVALPLVAAYFALRYGLR